MIKVLLSAFASMWLLLSSSHCSATPIYMSSQQITELEDNLIILHDNNERLAAILDMQSEELIRLKSISERQSKMLTASQSDLAQSKASLLQARKSLQTANEELSNALQSYKKQKEKEATIKRQRNFWSVVAGGLAVGIVIALAR